MVFTEVIRWALRTTAVLNVGAGLAAVAWPALNARLLLGPAVVLDGQILRYHLMLWLFVAAMGVGYAVASRDPERQTALLWCGGLGKLCAVAVWAEMLWHGLGAAPLALAVLWDGTLGVMFLVYAASRR